MNANFEKLLSKGRYMQHPPAHSEIIPNILRKARPVEEIHMLSYCSIFLGDKLKNSNFIKSCV